MGLGSGVSRQPQLLKDDVMASLVLEPPYACPYLGSQCSVKGNVPELVQHLTHDHNVDMHDGFTFNLCYVQAHSHEKEKGTPMLSVITCHGRQFCLNFEPFLFSMAPCYRAFLRVMGDDTEAKKFSYRLEIGGAERSLTWQGVPRSLCDNHVKGCDSLDGLVIPRSLAHFFSDGNEQELKLQVKGRIWIERSIDSDRFGGEESSVFRARHGVVQNLLSMLSLKDTKRLEKVAESLELLYDCPYHGSECSVTTINIPDIVAHLKDDHNVNMCYGSTFNHRYVISHPHKVENVTWVLNVFNCFGRQFCLQLKSFHVDMAPFYILFMWFMGEDKEGKKFRYSLQFGGNERTLTWQGFPRSFGDGQQKDCEGLMIPRNLAFFFSGGKEQELSLRVIGHIWKE